MSLPIKYEITLDEEQKEAKRLILENEITFITGKAGVGKSSIVAQVALDLIFKQGFKKVYLTRPAVETGRSLGFLPGPLSEKLDPYLEAFKDALHTVYKHHDKIDSLFEKLIFETYALQFIRGKNIKRDTLLIVDEIQLTTAKEVEAIVTRANPGCKIVLLGDFRQCDGNFNGFEFLMDLQKNVPDIKHIELTQNHRSGIVRKILDYIYK